MKKSHLAILLNVLYWMPRFYSIWIYFTPQVNLSAPQIKTNLILSAESIIVSMVIFYMYYFFFAPMLFSKQREKISYALWFGSILIVIITAIGYGIQHAISPYYITSYWFWPVSNLLTGIYAAFIACLIKAFLNWYADIFYKRQLEKKNLETELALLKAQINPHFLFNTLNNIDVLIEKDAHTASVYLNKLSDILRFMLYESPAEKIALTQEMEYIHKYIELQKIRTSNNNYVSFDVAGDNGHLLIAPMLFIPFIENAFKHSVNKKINNAIEVKLTADKNEITFYCSNAYDASVLQTQAKSGLGLELIKNRLKLLYKDSYDLKIDKTDNRFTVNLTINIHDSQLHHN